MALRVLRGELDRRYSSDRATPAPWARAREELGTAKSYWLSTVRPNARPHVTTIAAVWLDGAMHFTTGGRERKAKNLARNPYCIVTTGYRGLEGLDLVVEGKATRVATAPALRGLAEAYRRKIRSAVSPRGARRGPVPPGHRRPRPRVSTPREEGPRLWQGRQVQPDSLAPLGTPVQPRPSRSRRC